MSVNLSWDMGCNLIAESNSETAGMEMPTGPDLSVPKLLVTGDAVLWFQRFDLCSKANGSTEQIKTAKRPTLFERRPGEIWTATNGRTTRVDGRDSDACRRYIQLHLRILRAAESLSVFIHELKKMQEHAMP
eukprot:Em0001g1712a